MIKVLRGKSGGKTDELIRISNDTKNIIVCSNMNETNRIKSRAKHLKLNIPNPITYYDLNNTQNIRLIGNFIIDNVEDYLSYTFNNKIKGFSMTANHSFSFNSSL